MNADRILMSPISSRYIAGKPFDETITPLVVASADGPFLIGLNGSTYLDWSTCLNAPFGHTHRLNTKTMPVNVGNYISIQRFELLSRLVELFPYIDGFQFRSSGTESVEAALRYVSAAIGKPLQLVTVEGCYHGLTLGSRILMGTSKSYYSSIVLPFPSGSSNDDAMDIVCGLLEKGPVAVFIETVQGGTLRKLPQAFIDTLLSFRSKYPGQLAIICDDMLASIRCGSWCSLGDSLTLNLAPDAIIGGKSWSNGFPFSFFGVATWIREAAGDILGTTSYGGNPIACAHVVDTIDRIKQEDILVRIKSIESKYSDEFKRELRLHDDVRRAEWHGMLFGLEVASPVKAQHIAERAAKSGLLVTLLGDGTLIRCSPPLNLDIQLLEEGLRTLFKSVKEGGIQ